jgi:hypothetical protein
MKAVVRNHCQQDCERQYNERGRLPGLQLSMPKSSSERRGWGGSFAVSGGRVTLPESSVRRTEQARPVICATEPAPAVGLLLLLWRRGSGRGGPFTPLVPWFIGTGMDKHLTHTFMVGP